MRAAPALLRLSVVIPTLHERPSVAGSVRSAFAAGADEVIVADGGSRDGTVEAALDAGARVIEAPRGRGAQLAAGAAAATGEALCFLHADGRLPRGAGAAIRSALAVPATAGGNFRVHFGTGWHGRLLAAWYLVLRRASVYYGDSAIFCRRSAFEQAGGFPPHPIMEDLTLVRRLRRQGRMVCLEGPVYASPRRWEQGGVARAWASWVVIQALYELHVPPARLAMFYRQIR